MHSSTAFPELWVYLMQSRRHVGCERDPCAVQITGRLPAPPLAGSAVRTGAGESQVIQFSWLSVTSSAIDV